MGRPGGNWLPNWRGPTTHPWILMVHPTNCSSSSSKFKITPTDACHRRWLLSTSPQMFPLRKVSSRCAQIQQTENCSRRSWTNISWRHRRNRKTRPDKRVSSPVIWRQNDRCTVMKLFHTITHTHARVRTVQLACSPQLKSAELCKPSSPHGFSSSAEMWRQQTVCVDDQRRAERFWKWGLLCSWGGGGVTAQDDLDGNRFECEEVNDRKQAETLDT